MSKKRKLLNILISLALLLAIWVLLSSLGQSGKSTVPSPYKVVSAFKEMIEDEILFEYIGISIYRFFAGYITSVITGVILGLILGHFEKVWDIVDPMVQILRPISPTAWFPFIVMAFGIGNLPAIVIIFISGFFTMLISTVTAVKRIDKNYLKVAETFEIRGIKLITKVVLPAIFPSIANAMHIALGSAWIFLVAGEMVGAQSGLGYLIIDARNDLRPDMLLAGIILIGIIGLILDKLIGLFERKINSKWGRFA